MQALTPCRPPLASGHGFGSTKPQEEKRRRCEAAFLHLKNTKAHCFNSPDGEPTILFLATNAESIPPAFKMLGSGVAFGVGDQHMKKSLGRFPE
jgi:hypothetical protein